MVECMTQTNPPIVCDMTNAPDTLDERMSEYRIVFARLTARERIGTGIGFRFPYDAELDARIRRLAALDKDCCPFFEFDITGDENEIRWNATVADDPIARQILDEYYELPITAAAEPAELYRCFSEAGLTVVIDDNGTQRPATPAEIGIVDAPSGKSS